MKDKNPGKYARSLERLLKASREITTTTDLKKLYRKVTGISKELLDLDFSTLLILSEDKTRLIQRDTIGFPESTIGSLYFVGGQGLSTYVVRSKSPDTVMDFNAETRFEVPPIVKETGITSAICVPMMIEDHVFGVLIGHTLGKRDFDKDDVTLYQNIGNQAAVAIKNSMHIEELAEEKELLAVTLRSIGDGVITTDTKGNVLLINKVSEELTGWKQEQAAGRPLKEVFHIINEKTREVCEDPVEKVLRTGKIIGLANHTALISRDGTERIIADSAAPIHDRESRIIGVVLVFRDITEKQRTEEELQKAQKLESIGILAGGIAHDFNNLLTAILGNINMARIYAEPESKISERLAEAEKASMRARDLTQQLLTFSRGGAPVKKATLIGELIRDSASFALRGADVRCEFTLPDGLWPVEVDEGQISQVIHNLVINADQAMPEGGMIRVKAENIRIPAEDGVTQAEGKYVKITVEDQGIGIPKEYLEKIFDPYFTTKQKGSGLGLATTYSIIKNHDGRIDVDSEIGEGAAFSLYLPVSQAEGRGNAEITDSLFTGKGKVLVMDDEEMIREVAGEMLGQLGYKIAFAVNGAEAVNIYKREREAGHPFDAVIMDLTIPGGMGGKEAVSKLIGIDPDVKAIVSSGYSNDPIMADYAQHGFKGVVVKPYKVHELGAVLHSVLAL